MKFIVSKSKIETAAKHISQVINKKASIPILADIHFTVLDGMVSMTGSDGEVELRFGIHADTEGAGMFCVEASRLVDALSPLDEQPVTIIADTENGDAARFELQHETGHVHFPLEKADEFPMMEQEEQIESIMLPAREVASAIQYCLWTTAEGDLRPIMNGINFNVTEESTDIVASDGHSIMLYRTTSGSSGIGSFIMPKKAAKILPKILHWYDDDDVDIKWSLRQAVFTQEDFTLAFRLVEGRYPDYMSVIPKKLPHTIKADRSLLLAGVKKVEPFSPDSSNMITWTVSDKEIMMSADDYDRSEGAVDKVPVECDLATGQTVGIGMKAGKLISLLSKMPYSKLLIRFDTPDRAVVIESGDDTKNEWSLLGLTMPMIINS